MKISNLLLKKRNIVGIEINDSFIRICYYKSKNNGYIGHNKNNEEITFIEETLPDGIISNGAILDIENLSKRLKDIWKKEKLSKSYAIVSIQEDKIFSKLFEFPKNLKEKELDDAVSLAINFQLPSSKNDNYIGFEKIENKDSTPNEVIIETISKKIIDEYVKLFDIANINIVAIESNLSSITRILNPETDKPELIIKDNKSSSTIFCTKNNNILFTRNIPHTFIKKDDLKKEIEKTKTWLEIEFKTEIKERDIESITIKKEYEDIYKKINTEKLNKCIISMSAMIRGKMRQGEDPYISLLPISTSDAYNYQKAKAFISLFRNIIIGVSVFFLIVFLAVYIFILSLAQNINKNSNISLTSIPPNITNNENLIKKVNNYSLASKMFLSDTINWSILLEEITSKKIDGIVISSISITSLYDDIRIVGISKDRDTLNRFKKILEESTIITGIEMPITNLEKKSDIPFSISFKLADLNLLYYK